MEAGRRAATISPMQTAPAAARTEDLYRARSAPAFVAVPRFRFLAIDGRGSPDDASFADAVGALFALAYTAKFMLKRAGEETFRVPPLEGLYESDAQPGRFDTASREHLSWTLMLRVPDALDDELIERARAEAARKRELPALARIRVETFDEGLCAQLLHVGPYSAECAPSSACTRSSPRTAANRTGATTRSTSATRGVRGRSGCGRSSASR
jgi:hypothetical protein